MKKSPPARKAASPKKAKASKAAIARTPTLVITILNDCSEENNQNIDPPHLSRTAGGGFPHQVEFTATTHAWVCLPKGFFTKDPVCPLELNAGESQGPFIVKGNAADTLSYSHSCDSPCDCFKAHVNGDVIIINA